MKKIFPILIFVLVSSCSNETSYDVGQILTRDGVIYSEKSNKPITGTLRYSTKSGFVSYETSYKNGIKHGIDKIYDENMRLITRANYKEGLLHGLYESFDPNGQVIFSGYYENGKEKGIWRFFDNTGKLLATGSSIFDARDNHFKNLQDKRKEEIEKRNIDTEFYLCNGTESFDLSEGYDIRVPGPNRAIGENLIIDFRKQKMTFAGLENDISEFTEYSVLTKYSEDHDITFDRKNKIIKLSVNDMDNYNEIVPGLGGYVVKHELFYQCEKVD